MAGRFDSDSDAAFQLSPPGSPVSAPTTTFMRPSFSRSQSRGASGSQAPLLQRLLTAAERLGRQSLRAFNKLAFLQKALVILAMALSAAFGIVLLLYSEQIFAWLVPVADRWRNLRGGWAILWFLTIATAFPPVIGYSTCVTLAGFLYGFPHG